jgi:predicted dehydrogenase
MRINTSEGDNQETNSEKRKFSFRRRDFLQGLATLPVLGLFAWAWKRKRKDVRVVPEVSVSIEKQPVEAGSELNVALLGAGEQGQVLLNACLQIPGIRFRAVCDIWEDYNQRRATRLLERYEHPVNPYIDFREMLDNEKELDAVIIATPDFWHAEHTIACLDAGLHVYCEKEMSNNLEDARRMVLAARSSGRLLQIGHQRRSNTRYLYCYEKLIREAGLLGKITNVSGQWNRSVQPDLGWPVKYEIDQSTLRKYGYDSMHHFRNWRWYKGMGGGPIVDLGSHQIDIYNWFLGKRPSTVMASGGTDYYDPSLHEWYDNVMAIFSYPSDQGVIRAFYQTLTTNSSLGYFESFLGDEGTLLISESANRDGIYREPAAPPWDEWVEKGYLSSLSPVSPTPDEGLLDVRESVSPESYRLPVEMTDPYHLLHLANFFDSIRGKEKLNCPPEVGYETAVTVLKVNEAIEKGEVIGYSPEDFVI